MQSHVRQQAELANAAHPFFKLPIKIRNNIYSMSQHSTPKTEEFTLSFGRAKPLFSGFDRQVALLHVCRRFRQDLLPFIFKNRNINFLFDGHVSTFVPPSISTLSTDILRTVSSMNFEFEIALPTRLHGLTRRQILTIQVELKDNQYTADLHFGSSWETCDPDDLADFLSKTVDDIETNLQIALRRKDLFRGLIVAHALLNGRPIDEVLDGDDVDEVDNDYHEFVEQTEPGFSTVIPMARVPTRPLTPKSVHPSKRRFKLQKGPTFAQALRELRMDIKAICPRFRKREVKEMFDDEGSV